MPDLRTNKQASIIGKPFAVVRDNILATYMRWDDAQKTSRIARINQKTNDFEMYSRDLKQWVPIEYKKEDGWRKQFMRVVYFDQEYTFENLWDNEAKKAGTFTTRVLKVPLGSSVETKIQEKLADERRRGSTPFKMYMNLTQKSTGDRPIDVEYNLEFSKNMDDADFNAMMAATSTDGGQQQSLAPTAPTPAVAPAPTPAPVATETQTGGTAAPDFNLDLAPAAPAPAEEDPETTRQKQLVIEVVGNIESRTTSIPKESIGNYKASMVSQVASYFEANNITYTTPEAVIDELITKISSA